MTASNTGTEGPDWARAIATAFAGVLSVVAHPRAAALGVATVLENRERSAGQRVATIICGSNVMISDYERWVLSPG